MKHSKSRSILQGELPMLARGMQALWGGEGDRRLPAGCPLKQRDAVAERGVVGTIGDGTRREHAVREPLTQS